jgi:hypothetical protein
MRCRRPESPVAAGCRERFGSRQIDAAERPVTGPDMLPPSLPALPRGAALGGRPE